jgi:hypothetical protein
LGKTGGWLVGGDADATEGDFFRRRDADATQIGQFVGGTPALRKRETNSHKSRASGI